MPADTLAPRYERLWGHVATALPHCHRTVFCDNAADEGPREVAAYRYEVVDYPPIWPPCTPEPLFTL